jgi:hypothetical protein
MNTIMPNGKGGFSNFKMTPVEDTAITQKRATIVHADGTEQQVGVGSYERKLSDGTMVVTDVDQNGNTSTRAITGGGGGDKAIDYMKAQAAAMKEAEFYYPEEKRGTPEKNKIVEDFIARKTQEILDKPQQMKREAEQRTPEAMKKHDTLLAYTGATLREAEAGFGASDDIGQAMGAIRKAYPDDESMPRDVVTDYARLNELLQQQYRTSLEGPMRQTGASPKTVGPSVAAESEIETLRRLRREVPERPRVEKEAAEARAAERLATSQREAQAREAKTVARRGGTETELKYEKIALRNAEATRGQALGFIDAKGNYARQFPSGGAQHARWELTPEFIAKVHAAGWQIPGFD